MDHGTIQTIEGWYHDSGLFLMMMTVFILCMDKKQLYLTQLKADLSGPEENGLNRIVAQDKENADLWL